MGQMCCCTEKTKDPLNDNIQTNLIKAEFSLQVQNRPQALRSSSPLTPAVQKVKPSVKTVKTVKTIPIDLSNV